ncbi:MAG: membrane dipeptidase [Chloroflexota bacterium]|nr:membrane dipeptidase [Chloroflexota bacterium]
MNPTPAAVNNEPFLIDAHLDLAYNALELHRDLRRPLVEIRAAERRTPPAHHGGTCLVSIPELLKGKIALVGGSIFVGPASKHSPTGYHNRAEAHTQAVKQLDYYRRLNDEDQRVRLVRTSQDLQAVLAASETATPLVGIFMVMEGAAPIREPSEVSWWVERGLRGVGLTWAAGTRYAGGNSHPGPLTDAGRSLLQAMAEHHLLLDLSHLWEDAADSALDAYPGPIAASHANPRAFVDSPRALSDDLIRRIAARDGVIGVVPFNRMLEPGWNTSLPRLPLQRVVEAIDYICQLVGSAAHVGLGSDFDGGFGRESIPAGLESSADLHQLAPLLQEQGYSATQIDQLFNQNWLRLFKDVLPAQ